MLVKAKWQVAINNKLYRGGEIYDVEIPFYNAHSADFTLIVPVETKIVEPQSLNESFRDSMVTKPAKKSKTKTK